MVARSHKKTPPRPLIGSVKKTDDLPTAMPQIHVLDSGEVKTQKILLTPELAAYLLATQGVNRKPSRAHTAFIAENVDSDEWQFTHQGVALDNTGKMIDGQQRCMVVIRTNTPIEVLMTTGLDPDVFKVLDSGRRRSPSDVLGMRGEMYTAQTASTVRLLHAYNVVLHSETLTMASAGQMVVSATKVLDFLDRFPEIRESIPLGFNMARRTNVTPSVASALHFVMQFENKEMADRIAHQVDAGVDLKVGDLALALRNYNKYQSIRSRQTVIHTIFNGGRRALDGKEVRYLKNVKELPPFKVFDAIHDNAS